MPRSSKPAAMARSDSQPAACSSLITGASSSAHSCERRATVALPAFRAFAVRRAPRSPPSFTPRRLAAARAAFVRSEIMPASSWATVAICDGISLDQWQAAQAAGEKLGLQLVGIELRDQPCDYERGLAQAPAEHSAALIVMRSPIFFLDRQRLADFAFRHRMASIFALRK